jgi:CheY-like chemotaxis protein
VRVTVSRLPAGPARPEQLLFSVRDTGIGIPADRLDRLFKPFSQVDASTTRHYGGTGLGLTICEALVKCMGGRMRVFSTPGIGSDFQFEIPLHVSAEEPSADSDASGAVLPPPPPAVSLSALRILVAEDDPVNQRVIHLLLDRLGHSCTAVNDGLAALAATTAQPFDVILLDMQMPQLDGYETARRLGEVFPAAARPWIIAMTAQAMSGDREKCLAAGMDDYLAKPVSKTTLALALARAEQQLARRPPLSSSS